MGRLVGLVVRRGRRGRRGLLVAGGLAVLALAAVLVGLPVLVLGVLTLGILVLGVLVLRILALAVGRVLLLGGRKARVLDIVLDALHALLELHDPLPQAARDLRQALPEDQERDDHQ